MTDEISLTPKAIKVLRLAKEKGYVVVADAQRYYSCSEKEIREKLVRLVTLGYLEIVPPYAHFKWTGQEFENGK
jgi:Fic family protein